MPELPEVETIRKELARAIIGKKISGVTVSRGKIIKEPGVEKFRKGLKGVVIKGVLRRGKALILELDNGKSLVAHLRMTGQLIYPGDGKRSRVSFHFSDSTAMDFNDQRLFAELRLLDDWRSSKFIQKLGPEPSELDLKTFTRMLGARKTRIKPLLMEQDFIAGIGNIYASEMLFRAKIDPCRPAGSLSPKEKKRLLAQMRRVLKEAIRSGGSSVDDYVRLSGKPGGYGAYHRVYGRRGLPCFICKTPIRRITLGSRGTYFCPKCQR